MSGGKTASAFDGGLLQLLVCLPCSIELLQVLVGDLVTMVSFTDRVAVITVKIQASVLSVEVLSQVGSVLQLLLQINDGLLQGESSLCVRGQFAAILHQLFHLSPSKRFSFLCLLEAEQHPF